MCLLVIAVCSSIVIAIFNVQRVHVAEAAARRHLVVMHSLQDAAREHAVAVLIDQPAYRGPLGPFVHPDDVDCSYQMQIADSGSNVQVSTLVQAAGISRSGMYLFPSTAIDSRRASLGL